MSLTIHTLGLPRIGPKRELKTALEAYWKKEIGEKELRAVGAKIRQGVWEAQKAAGVDWINIGDFSFYDHVLDTSLLFGVVPKAFSHLQGLEQYFALARGDVEKGVRANPMVKWFDTNYHYIVPLWEEDTSFRLQPDELLSQIREARALGYEGKVQILGPVSFLYLGRWKEGKEEDYRSLGLLEGLLSQYKILFTLLEKEGISWVQVDEPILVFDDLGTLWKEAFTQAYGVLELGENSPLQILLTTYFESLEENLDLALSLPVKGLHLDLQKNRNLLPHILASLKEDQILSLGVVQGRSVWRDNLGELILVLRPIQEKLGERLLLAPDCSLLHLPWSLEGESLPKELEGRLSFTREKLEDLGLLARILEEGVENDQELLIQRAKGAEQSRIVAKKRENKIASLKGDFFRAPYLQRKDKQKTALALPLFPSTTIGSFPQTREIRSLRRLWRAGKMSDQSYKKALEGIITENIRLQEEVGLDVLVHGEPERSDMVAFFAQALEGFWQSTGGWVQSYGSRCVKPPVIHGLVSRKKDLGAQWTFFAQSLSQKPVKGMLTGPVTLLKWAFPPQGEALQNVAYDIALAIQEEVRDLAQGGIGIIQIDEPAYREILPLKKNQWAQALAWASRAFRLSCISSGPEIQIHSHMCYSDFNSILQGIKAMDADVVSIETSRGHGRLFQTLSREGYHQGLGPGVWDIHSPIIPQVKDMEEIIASAAEHLEKDNLWVNPDCGLKTRSWEEVLPSLKNLVTAAKSMREKLSAPSLAKESGSLV